MQSIVNDCNIEHVHTYLYCFVKMYQKIFNLWLIIFCEQKYFERTANNIGIFEVKSNTTSNFSILHYYIFKDFCIRSMSDNEIPVVEVSIKREVSCDLTVEKCFSQKAIVCALAPLIRIEKRALCGVVKEFCIRKCPNGLRCKKVRGEIDFLNKSGYKNPYSHLLSCLCKVSW